MDGEYSQAVTTLADIMPELQQKIQVQSESDLYSKSVLEMTAISVDSAREFSVWGGGGGPTPNYGNRKLSKMDCYCPPVTKKLR